MPNWNSVLREISVEQVTATASPHDLVRRRYMKRLHRKTGRNLIAYYSGWLSKTDNAVVLTDEDKNGFMLCVHELDRSKGLDLILHTPGGDAHAAASLVNYLREMFGRDIRAIVPQLAMSAGTMIACSCKSVIMGKQSSLGPIDPQFGVIAVANLLQEVEKAHDEIIKNPAAAAFWAPILSQITPSFIERCEQALKDSQAFLDRTLRQNMFADVDAAEIEAKVKSVTDLFGNRAGVAHNTHIHYEQCADSGLVVQRLEDDDVLQDLVLTIHHCYMHTLMNTPVLKITENHLGKALAKLQAPHFLPLGGQPMALPQGQGPIAPFQIAFDDRQASQEPAEEIKPLHPQPSAPSAPPPAEAASHVAGLPLQAPRA